jgi:hypothetical protein
METAVTQASKLTISFTSARLCFPRNCCLFRNCVNCSDSECIKFVGGGPKGG